MSLRLLAGLIAAVGALALGVAGGAARPASGVTLSMLANVQYQPGYKVVVANFERVHPNIAVNITYPATSQQEFQLETTELAAGTAPDLLDVSPGCGTPISVCVLAKAAHLAPMINKPWVKRSLPLVLSRGKHGQSLVIFTPIVSPMGIWTNDDRFRQLGLKIPQTFQQLLGVCRKTKAAGVAAFMLPGGDQTTLRVLIVDIAVATVYGKDTKWAAKLKAGKVTFAGTPGWHQALQELVEMNDSGCFEPGVAGTSAASARAQFVRGQGLMLPGITLGRGLIAAGSPQFAYSHHPFPSGTDPNQTRTLLEIGTSVGVNSHSSAANQAAAQTFIDFVARPKQDALLARTTGGVTQYEFLKGQIPDFMSDYRAVLKKHTYVVNPAKSWWNPGVVLALEQNEIGVITGQRSIDDVLKAMDAAWKLGPA